MDKEWNRPNRDGGGGKEMNEEIKKNIAICKEIRKNLIILGKSKATRADIFFLVDELKTKVKWLKELYRQIID